MFKLRLFFSTGTYFQFELGFLHYIVYLVFTLLIFYLGIKYSLKIYSLESANTVTVISMPAISVLLFTLYFCLSLKSTFVLKHVFVILLDYILSATWVFLALLGGFVQYFMSKGKQFPKSGFIEQKRVRKYFINMNKEGENTPILINGDTTRRYGANNVC